MAHNRNASQIIAARNVRRRATPYIIQNDVMQEMIAANFEYKEVKTTHQVTADWIRNCAHIFLKGVSVRSILMKERAKVFIAGVNNYLANDPTQEKMAIWKMLCIAATQEETNYVVSEELAIRILEALIAAKTWEALAAPDVNDFLQAQGLKDAVLTAKAIFTDADQAQESAKLLEKIWREHLLAANLPETVKAAYVKKLFATAHQGGFLYSLATAYMQAFLLNSPYRLSATKELSHSAFVRFNMNGGNIEIIESIPIYKIYNEDYQKSLSEQQEVIDENGERRKINLYLFEPTIKHEIKMQADEAVLNIMYLQDKIYSDKAVEVLCVVFPELQKVRKDVELYLNLADYANKYLENGHNYTEIERLFNLYPQLNDVVSVKTEYSSVIPGRAEANAKGDKIFYYLGAHYNDYVAELIESENEFQHSEQAFVLYLKLMYRLGNAASLIEPEADKGHKAFVLELLKKYYAAAGVANIDLTDADLKASKYQEAYQYFVNEGVFAGENKIHAEQWSMEEQMARNPAMLHIVIEGIDQYIIDRTKAITAEQNSNSMFSQLTKFVVSNEERTRGLRRAEALNYLLREAPTQFAKRVIVYCLVATSDGVKLKDSIKDIIQAFTPEILKRVIAKDLKALNIPDHDFTKLENEIIIPLISKISSMTPEDSKNHIAVFADRVKALSEFNQKDIIISTASHKM